MLCPRCDTRMRVIETARGLAVAIYRTWRCPRCRHEVTTEETIVAGMTRRARKYVRDLLRRPL